MLVRAADVEAMAEAVAQMDGAATAWGAAASKRLCVLEAAAGRLVNDVRRVQVPAVEGWQ